MVKGGQALAALFGQAGLAVVITCGLFLRIFVLGFSLGRQPPENDQVVNLGRVVIRRVRRAGQVLAVQVWHRRAA